MTFQVDVVYPSNPALDSEFSGLETRYYSARVRIADVFALGEQLRCVIPPCLWGEILSELGINSDVLMLTPSMSGSSDVWCIDPRGIMTLSVCKQTYEALGLTGSTLPFKGHADRHGQSPIHIFRNNCCS